MVNFFFRPLREGEIGGRLSVSETERDDGIEDRTMDIFACCTTPDRGLCPPKDKVLL